MSSESTKPLLLGKKRSQTGLSVISSSDQPSKKMRRTETIPDLKDNGWVNQICHGMDRQNKVDLSTKLQAAHALANSSSYMGKIFPGVNSSSERPTTPPKEYRPPNGSGSFEENPSTSITSSSLSLIDGKSWNNTRHTSRLNLTPDNHTPTKESLPTTLPSEILLAEDKRLYSPNVINSPTYIQPSSYLTELNSPPPTPHPCHVEPSLLRRQKDQLKLATNTTLTRAVPTTLASTGTSAKNAEENIHKTTVTTHKRDDEGLQPNYRQYNLWGTDNQKPMTTAEWSETAVPLSRPPKSELENPVANVTIPSHAHLFAVKTPINIDVFQSLLSSHPNRPFVDSVLAGLREGFWPWANTLSPHLPSSFTQEPNGRYDEAHLVFFRDQLHHELKRERYSSSLGNTLLPGMFCMPIYTVPKPGVKLGFTGGDFPNPRAESDQYIDTKLCT